MAASAYHVIWKKVENHIVVHSWIFRQSSGIIIFLSKYYIVILNKLVVSFLDVLFFLAPSNIIRASWETKKERFSYSKKYIEEFTWQTSLFWLHALLSILFFVAFFVSSLPLPKWRTCLMVPTKIHNIAMGGVLCDDVMSENLLQFNTSWFAYLRTWYYFKFCIAPVVLAMTLQ